MKPKKLLTARILIPCDRVLFGPGWPVAEVANTVGCAVSNIEYCKKYFVEVGVEAAQRRTTHVHPSRQVIFDEQPEARLLTLACSDAPAGLSRRSLSLLAEKAVKLGFVPSVSHMTLHHLQEERSQALSERVLADSHKQNAAFVARMKDMLDVYARAPGTKHLGVGRDEANE